MAKKSKIRIALKFQRRTLAGGLIALLLLITVQVPLLGAHEGHVIGVIAHIVENGSVPAGEVVINEFLPNPNGDDAALKPGGEWVELYNRGGVAVNVNNWALYDSVDTHELLITSSVTDTGDTIVPAGGHLVVYRNGDSDFVLNNSGGDSVRLFNALIIVGGTLIDAHTYTDDAATEKTTARIPDGSANWVDPVPTPGEPNELSEAEIQGEPIQYTYDPAEDVEVEDGDPILPLEFVAPISDETTVAEPAAAEPPADEAAIETEPVVEETPPTEEVTPPVEPPTDGTLTEPGDTLTGEPTGDQPADEPTAEPAPAETPTDETPTQPNDTLTGDQPSNKPAAADTGNDTVTL